MARPAHGILAIGLMLASSGCYSPYFYPTYGRGGYPGTVPPMGGYGAPPPVMAPPPGGYIVPNGPTSPGTFSPQPGIGPQPTFDGQGGDFYTPNSMSPSTGGSTGGSRQVPNPPGNGDSADLDGDYYKPAPLRKVPADEGSQPSSNESEKKTTPIDAFGRLDPDSSETDIEQTGGESRDASSGNPHPAEPLIFDDSEESSESPKSPTTSNDSPFGFDAVGYSQLSGIVTFDPNLRSRVVVYTDKSRNDQYQGNLVLADHPSLRTLSEGDTVRIQGRLLPNSRDRLGKPKYQIRSLQKFVPQLVTHADQLTH